MTVVRPAFESGCHSRKGFQPNRKGTKQPFGPFDQPNVHIYRSRPKCSSDLRNRLHGL